MTLTSEITVPTAQASGYLQRLCKHFGHKLPVEMTAATGQIRFDFGTADLEATDTGLTLRGRADSQEDMDRLKRVMASHLERFAFREGLVVTWT